MAGDETDVKTVKTTPVTTVLDTTAKGTDNSNGGGTPPPQSQPLTPLGQHIAFKIGIGVDDNLPKDMFGRPIYNAIVTPIGTMVPGEDKGSRISEW